MRLTVWFIALVLGLLADKSLDSRAPAVRREIAQALRLENTLPEEQKNNETRRARIEAAYRRIAQKYPDSALGHHAYAEFLWKIGEPKQAIEQWQEAQRLDPSSAVVANSLGGALLRFGRAAEAADQFLQAIRLENGNALYHFNLGNVEFLLRRDLTAAWKIDTAELLRRALAEFREATRLAPSDLEYAHAYAETFYGIPDPDWTEAQLAWQHVLDLSKQPDFVYLQLARISLKRGHKLEARAFLDKIADPRHESLKLKLRKQAEEP